MLLTDDILDSIVTQTNLYADQYMSTHNLPPRSRVHGWSRETFTREELKKFIAHVIIMGLVNLPTLEDHLVTTWPYSSQTCSKVNKFNCLLNFRLQVALFPTYKLQKKHNIHDYTTI